MVVVAVVVKLQSRYMKTARELKQKRVGRDDVEFASEGDQNRRFEQS